MNLTVDVTHTLLEIPCVERKRGVDGLRLGSNLFRSTQGNFLGLSAKPLVNQVSCNNQDTNKGDQE